MKQILIFLTCTVFCSTVFSQAVNETNFNQGYDTVTTNQWNGSAWIPYRRSMYSNNAQCLTTSILTQNWVSASSTWVNFTLETITYNVNNQVRVDGIQSWDQSSGSWIQGTRNTNSYNASNLRDSIFGETWVNGSWQTNFLYTFTYNSDQTVNQVLEQVNISSNTTILIRQTYSYPDNTSYQVLTESGNNSTWTVIGRSTIHYLGSKNKVLTSLTENWINNQWVNGIFQTTTYDNNNYRTNMLSQLWNSTSQSYVNSSQTNYTNSSNGRVAQQVDQQWNTGTNTWVNQTQTNYTYNCNTSLTILPLTLIEFTASKNNSYILLTWQTTNEINSDHFVIQRSLNGADFTDIGRINAHGKINVTDNYNYIDNTNVIKSGTVYYRLQIVDKDGKAVDSKIITVSINNQDIGLVIKPIPAHSFLTITTGALKSIVTISNLSGQVLLKQNINTAGEHQINTSSFAKGIYIVSINTTQGSITQKAVIE